MSNVIEKLLAAHTAVLEAQAALDLRVESTPCRCCGVTLRKSLDDFNASKEMDAMTRKLSHYARKIEAGEWHGRDANGVLNETAGTLKKSTSTSNQIR